MKLKRKKGYYRIIAFLLSVIMVVGMLPLDALAVDFSDAEEREAYFEERVNCDICGRWIWEGDGSKCEHHDHCAPGYGCGDDVHCPGCGACGTDEYRCDDCLYCFDCLMEGNSPYTHCEYCFEEGKDYCQACSDFNCDGAFVVCNECIEQWGGVHCEGCFMCFHEHPDMICEYNPDYCIECCGHCDYCGEHIWDHCYANEGAMHCSTCVYDLGAYNKCEMCGEYYCAICGEGPTFDRDDDYCESCIEGYDMWCDICMTVDPDREYDQNGPGMHCIDCCELCDECGECIIGKELEVCDDCGLCVECCHELSLLEGCFTGEVCRDSGDWDGHICAFCQAVCACEEDFCEYCGFCMNCCESQSECSNSMCVEDPEYEEHFCDECGACFHDVEPCEWCINDKLCKGCCTQRSVQEGCDHGICMESYEWSEHRCIHNRCFEDCDQCKEEGILGPEEHKHVWNSNNICTICGARNDGRPVIIEQPKSVRSSLRSTYKDQTIVPKVMFTIFTTGQNVQYEWYIVGKGKITEGEYGITGSNTSTLTMEVPNDGCNGFYTFQCRVYNEKGDVWSEQASLIQSHIYETLWKEDPTDSGAHFRSCIGEGCEEVLKERHVYEGWTILKEATQTENGKAVRNCIYCGHEDVKVLPSFSIHTHEWEATVLKNNKNKHQVSCSLCLKVKELAIHEYGEWTIIKKPTEDEKGKQYRECSACGFRQDEEIPLLEHEHFMHYYYHPADGSLTITSEGCTGYSCINADGSENPNFHYQICTAIVGGKECGFKMKGYISKHHWNGDSGGGQNGFVRDPETDEVYRICVDCGYKEYSDIPGYYCYMLHGTAMYYNLKGEEIHWAKAGDTVIAMPGSLVADVYFQEWGSASRYDHVIRDNFPEMELTEEQKKSKCLTFIMPSHPVYLGCIYQRPSQDTCTHEYWDPKTQKMISFIEEEVEAYEATCNAPGRTRRIRCMACWKTIEKDKEIPATGHDFQIIKNSVVAPACTTTGYTGDSKCTKCGQIMKGDPLPKLGHEYSTELEIVKYSDCIHKGCYGYRCTREGCDHFIRDIDIPATGHEKHYVECDEKYHWERCYECDAFIVGSREKHDYDLHITRGGVEYDVCSFCGESKLSNGVGESNLAVVTYRASNGGEGYYHTEKRYHTIGETIMLPDPSELDFKAPENMEFRYWLIGSQKLQPGETYTIDNHDEEIVATWSTPQETVDAVISATATFPAPGVRVSDMRFYATNSGNYTYYAYSGAEEWYDAETGAKLGVSDRFEFGKAYYMKVRLSQKNASKFQIPTLESVKNMRITLDTEYSSAAYSPKDGFMNGQAFTVEQDGSIIVYFGMSKNDYELNTKESGKVTAQVAGDQAVVTYKLKDLLLTIDEYEEYDPNEETDAVREVTTNLGIFVGQSVKKDDHVELSIDGGETWYKASTVASYGFWGLYPDTTYTVQLRRTDLGNLLNPYAGKPVIFYSMTQKTASVPEAYLYDGAWPLPEQAFDQYYKYNEHTLKLWDAKIAAEVKGAYETTITYTVTSSRMTNLYDKKLYVVLQRQDADNTLTVVGSGPAKLQADGTFIYKIPTGLYCNAAYAFFMGRESTGEGKEDDVFYSKIQMQIVDIQNDPTYKTVSFEANGGTGSMASVAVENGATYILPECGFIAPAGSEFDGWDVNGTVIQPGEKVTVTGNLKLKATWWTAEIRLDSKSVPSVGGSIFVDESSIENIITFDDNLMMAYIDDDYAYEWYADGTVISGKTGSSITVTSDLAGKTIYAVLNIMGCKFTTNKVTVEDKLEELDKSSPKLQGATASADGITVTWTANSGVPKYAIFRKVAGGKWSKIAETTGSGNESVKATAGTTCSYFDGTAEVGKTYAYTVRGVDESGKYITSYDTNGVSATMTSQEQLDKGSPVLQGATASADGITVMWKANSGVLKYAVFRKEAGGKYAKVSVTTGSGNEAVKAAVGSTCSFLDNTAEAGKAYVYTVRGIDENGKYITSYDANGVSATMVSQQEQLDKSSPVLQGATASVDGITVTWKANSGVFKYAVFRKEAGGKWTRIGETTGSGNEAVKAAVGSTCSFLDNTAEAGKTYVYTVRGIDDNGKYITSYDANGVSATMTSQQEQLDKSSPVLLGAVASANGITVTWTANSGVPKYAIFRKVAGGKWTRIGETTGSGDESVKATAGATCSFVDGTAEVGTTYIYTVRGMDESGKFVTSYDTNGVSCAK